jgi:hypothetical protein
VAGRAGAGARSGCRASRGVTHLLGCGWLQCLLGTAGADDSGMVRAAGCNTRHLRSCHGVTSGGGLLCVWVLADVCLLQLPR